VCEKDLPMSKKDTALGLLIVILVVLIVTVKSKESGISKPSKTANSSIQGNSATPQSQHDSRRHILTIHNKKSSQNKKRIVVRGKSSWSDSEIRELGEQFKAEKDKHKRRELFEKLLSIMTAENALDIREHIAHLSQDSKEFIEFHREYGAVAGDAAVINGAQTKKRDLVVTMTGWAKENPEAALDWYEKLNDGKKSPISQNLLAEGILRGLAEKDTEMATEFLLADQLSDNAKRKLAGILAGKIWKNSNDSNSAADITVAAEWTKSLSDDKIKNAAQEAIVHRYANIDPKGAVSWLTSQEGTTDKSFYSAFSAWARKDATTAGDYINTMPDSSKRDSAITGLAVNIVHKNPEQAINMAADISEPKKRLQMITYSGSVGFKKNTNGLRKWLENSTLSAKDQAHVLKSHYRSLKKKKKR